MTKILTRAAMMEEERSTLGMTSLKAIQELSPLTDADMAEVIKQCKATQLWISIAPVSKSLS
jgi:hypothetical protein